MIASTNLQSIGFIFDLDGTLVDSAYQHALAWQRALQCEGMSLPLWRIHRQVGMSGGLFTELLLRQLKREVTADQLERLQQSHAQAYEQLNGTVRLLPGARELLKHLIDSKIPWAIATSGRLATARHDLAMLAVPERAVITRDDVTRAKPDPDVLLVAAARLDLSVNSAIVVGDSIWDMLAARRAGMLGVGMLSGGYGQDELERAGAARVYEDPGDLLQRLYELGLRF